MTQSRSTFAAAKATIARLAEPPCMAHLNPIAARFIYSLRLIALHQRVRRDPVAELAVRLSSVDAAAKTLALSYTISAAWPENLHVSPFCCGLMSHDEASIAALIETVVARDRQRFDQTIAGLVRPDRFERIWDAAQDLVMAELRAR
ncbi:DNA-directed RNA polymerase subunit beta' [Qipengyuania sp. ASV99]|uniref:DNA-directed RNA polymerase subunit beta' n=1 Tax=Qipengyuania sp. ASV99 TaxID=3399681 RepID=UPI003A4C7202